MNLKPVQAAHLKVFEDTYQLYAKAQNTLEATLRATLEAELGDMRREASLAGNRAVAVGVPITRLGDKAGHGMRTKNFGTIRAFLDITAGLVTETAEEIESDFDPLTNRYSFNPTPNPAITNSAGIVSIDLTNATDTETAEQFAKTLKHQEWSLVAATKAGLLTVTMNVLRNPNNGALVLMNITEDQGGLNGTDFLPSYSKRHPVSAWAMQYPTEVVAWLNEHDANDDNEEV